MLLLCSNKKRILSSCSHLWPYYRYIFTFVFQTEIMCRKTLVYPTRPVNMRIWQTRSLWLMMIWAAPSEETDYTKITWGLKPNLCLDLLFPQASSDPPDLVAQNGHHQKPSRPVSKSQLHWLQLSACSGRKRSPPCVESLLIYGGTSVKSFVLSTVILTLSRSIITPGLPKVATWLLEVI